MTQQSLRTDVLKSVDAAQNAVADGLANGLDAVRAEAGELKAMAAQGASDAVDIVAKGINSAEREADIILDAAKQQGAALQKLLTEELRVHPLRSLGIAAAIGLAAGYLTRR